MSYSKLVKVCQDFALGKQQVNNAIGNLEDFYNAWTAEHGKHETVGPFLGLAADPYTVLGVHNLPQIPRAVVEVTVSASAPGGNSYSISAQQPVVAVTRIGAGFWFIAMDSTLSTFWGIAEPTATSNSDIRLAVPRTLLPAGVGQPGVYVTTYDSASGTFVATDYSFTCAVYAY